MKDNSPFVDTSRSSGETDQPPVVPQVNGVEGGRAAPKSANNWLQYVVGAALAYGVCVVFAGRPFSTELATILKVGLIMGLFFFPFFTAPHFLLQLLGHWILVRLWHPKKWVEFAILNLPALILLSVLLIDASIPPSPQAMKHLLQRHFDTPLPASVDVKSYHLSRGMDGGTLTYVFAISSNELSSLLTNSDLHLDSSGIETNEVRWYQEKAKELTHGTASIEIPCAVYRFSTNEGISHTRKTLVVGSNGVDVVFSETFF